MHANARSNTTKRRVISIDKPGEYTTRSYLLYGQTGQACEDENSVNRPGKIFDVLDRTFYLLVTARSIMSFDERTRSLSVAYNGDDINYADIQFIALINTSSVLVSYPSASVIISATSVPCATGSTSTAGGVCNVQCSLVDNFVDATGKCTPCTTDPCPIGYSETPCTTNQDKTCTPCPDLELERGKYPRFYTTHGSCAAFAYTSPCKKNMYARVEDLICVPCPRFGSLESGFRAC
jgi:hypothetical protein